MGANGRFGRMQTSRHVSSVIVRIRRLRYGYHLSAMLDIDSFSFFLGVGGQENNEYQSQCFISRKFYNRN